MKKLTALLILILLITGGIYYYVALPAINLHSPGLWSFIISILAIGGIALLAFKSIPKAVKTGYVAVFGIIIAVFIVGGLLSSQIINAKKYCQLINISERDFSEDIKEVNYTEIPSLDKDSAEKLGLREMGTMGDLVSQFEVNNLYSQINYNNKPVRVTPLDYGDFFKWLANRKEGIPAYIRIDMTTQDVECVRLGEGIKYSTSEIFNRNIYRHLRFMYPTYIFDDISFEIDDNGTPVWICPVRDYTIGLFGGVKISKVIIVNAQNGSSVSYNIGEVPNWVDRVYSADLLISYYDYYGTLRGGYINSIIGQKGCLRTTMGYNYIALEDDVWVYTGVTSVTGDQSIVGFVLMNQRTAETRYYAVSGAEEYSAMASAEGQVQHLGYKATFPILLNIADQPTYFMALKDDAGLVKSYAMVNIEKYQIVAVGNSILECEQNYIKLMNSNGIEETDTEEIKETEGTIERISEVIIDGNSHYFIKLSSNDRLFDVDVINNIDILNYGVNSNVKFSYTEGVDYNVVNDITQ